MKNIFLIFFILYGNFFIYSLCNSITTISTVLSENKNNSNENLIDDNVSTIDDFNYDGKEEQTFCKINQIDLSYDNWLSIPKSSSVFYDEACTISGNGYGVMYSNSDFMDIPQFNYTNSVNTSGSDLYYTIYVANRRNDTIITRKIYLNDGILLLRRSSVIDNNSVGVFSFQRKPSYYLNVSVYLHNVDNDRMIYYNLLHIDVNVVRVSIIEITNDTDMSVYTGNDQARIIYNQNQKDTTIIIETDITQPQFYADKTAFIIASDPQPYRTKSGSETGPCGDVNTDSLCYKRVVFPKIDNMVNVLLPDGFYAVTIINGDLTEYGHYPQYKMFLDILGRIRIFSPLFIFTGLGNHDYENNVGHCTAFPDTSQNACARNMVRHLVELNYNTLKLLTTSFMDCTGCTSNAPDGSFMYGFGIPGVHLYFIQLNNDADYAVRLDHWAVDAINVKPNWPLLLSVVEKYAKMGYKFVINLHKPNKPSRLTELFAAGGGSEHFIFFVGHTHELSKGLMWENAHVFNSGAMFYGDFIRVKAEVIKANEVCLSVDGYSGKQQTYAWNTQVCL